MVVLGFNFLKRDAEPRRVIDHNGQSHVEQLVKVNFGSLFLMGTEKQLKDGLTRFCREQGSLNLELFWEDGIIGVGLDPMETVERICSLSTMLTQLSTKYRLRNKHYLMEVKCSESFLKI